MNIDKIREDFPILQRKVNGKQLIYLDSTATTQKPRAVIEAEKLFYEKHNANIHRGVHALSEEATEMHENSRERIAKFIGAKPDEIIFTRNATEAINLVKFSWGGANIQKGDRILTTEMEHHSNLVPWQMLAREKQAKLDFIGFDKSGFLIDKDIEHKVAGSKLVAFTQMSNVLGTINDAEMIIKKAHEAGAVMLVDAAQSVPHMPVDVKKLDADFLAFSGHKMLGPTGIGVLYGKKELLEAMPPFLGGGDMIKEVHLREASWNDVPGKFEAGTPNIAGAIGLGAAVDYLKKLGMENVRRHEIELTRHALEEMQRIHDINIYGPKDAEQKGGVISFTMGSMHSHDVASLLNDEGIAIRSGHHCAMPLLEKLGTCDACRASFYIYTKKEEIDALVQGLQRARKVFKLDIAKAKV